MSESSPALEPPAPAATDPIGERGGWPPLVRRIAAFVESWDGRLAASWAPDPVLDELLLESVRLQAAAIPAYGRLFRARGVEPARLRHWSLAPAVPTSAFKSLALHTAPPRLVFRSSGTTRGAERRSEHHHPYPELYRTVVDHSFAAFCLCGSLRDRPAVLSLVPPLAVVPDSSLSFMIDHLMTRLADPCSRVVCGRRGVDGAGAGAWLAERCRERRPVLVLGTALALDDLLLHLERTGTRLALAPESAVFETGGFKGRRREVSAAAMHARLHERLGIGAEQVIGEYGMTELTSQAYATVEGGGEPGLFRTPPWLLARVVDPLRLEPVAAGEVGVLELVDLANVGSVCAVLTEDLARLESAGFRLLGRAQGAELRGCSLTVEELSA